MELTSTDLFQLLQALLAAVAVVVPLILLYIRKRNRLSRAQYLLDLLDVHDRLSRHLGNGEEKANDHLALRSQIEEHVQYVRSEFVGATTKEASRLRFYISTLLEVFALTLVIVSINFEGKTGFLEGSLKYSGIHVLIVMALISLSVYLGNVVFRKMENRKGNFKRPNLLMFGLFNAFLIVHLLVLWRILVIVDPITRMF